jgi:hypothetical protein
MMLSKVTVIQKIPLAQKIANSKPDNPKKRLLLAS